MSVAGLECVASGQAVALTSPLFVSVGTMLIIPLGIIVEKWLHDYDIGTIPAIG